MQAKSGRKNIGQGLARKFQHLPHKSVQNVEFTGKTPSTILRALAQTATRTHLVRPPFLIRF